METIHHINIGLHILAGTIALITGTIAAFSGKGSKNHVRFGRYFARMIVVVIVSGLIGVFVFQRNNFLLVITLLSAYTCFGGVRVIRLQGCPQLVDYLAPVTVMSSAFYYLYYIHKIGLYWSPTVIYSTIGALFVVTTYDLCKVFMTAHFLKKAVMYEHTYKMVSALIAAASAFSGTVFPQYKPYSQFVPSIIGFACIFITFFRLANKKVSLKTRVSNSLTQ